MKNFAPAIGAAVLVAAAVFVFVYEKKDSTVAPASDTESAGLPGGVVAPGTGQPPPPAPPVVPLASPGTGTAPSSDQAAPGLGDLVGRIEAKVKSDPANLGNRILLAQTYGEIGRLDEGVAELRKIYAEKLDTGRVDMVLASLLIKVATPPALAEAGKLLDSAQKRDPSQAGFVQLYKGRMLVAQGKTDEAVKLWNGALAKLPAGDPARTQIEGEISFRGK
jgi:tetratricopeptide (TPR) repeat protein